MDLFSAYNFFYKLIREIKKIVSLSRLSAHTYNTSLLPINIHLFTLEAIEFVRGDKAEFIIERI